jgi:anti-sigma factor RsiW
MTTRYTQSDNLPESDIELLSAYLDNQLTVAERVALDKRLAADGVLRNELEELRTTRAVLRDLPAVTPPRSFTLDPATVKQRRSFLPWRWSLQLGGGLAGLALVLVFSLQFLFSTGGRAYLSAPANESVASRQAAATAPLMVEPTIAAASGGAAAPEAAAPVAEATSPPESAAAMMAPAAPTSAPAPAAAPESAAQETAPYDATADQANESTANMATQATEVIGNTGLSSPDTTQLYPAPPPNDSVATKTEEQSDLNLGLILGGGIGLLALAALVVLFLRGRGV